jgi:Rad3-related DNA helicase
MKDETRARMTREACASMCNLPMGDRSKCPICGTVAHPIDKYGGYRGTEEGRYCPRCGDRY